MLKPGEVQRVLQALLRERVPIRDLETVLETIGDIAARTKDTEILTEYARSALARTLCDQHNPPRFGPLLMLEVVRTSSARLRVKTLSV